ncbi:hypothetical protein PtA15_3A42 [Puccinia triticina]|uniref:Uncharacterized protein n=1 Tax=Puccinia triticina TaxID=208348 RepID=A0ABY7CBX0_9BASI|nr:uncharacterized protein PtA15_3A42 [Puccinia triticina]WAQ82679.1 hypothetical protein PtA15_3A42 [Puccinia triticina]
MIQSPPPDSPDPSTFFSTSTQSLTARSTPPSHSAIKTDTSNNNACVTLPSSSPIINPTLLRKPVGIILPPLSYLSLARPYLRPQAHYDPSEPLLLVSKAADRPSSNHFTVCAANGPPKAAATLHPVPDALLALGLKPRATFDKSTLITNPLIILLATSLLARIDQPLTLNLKFAPRTCFSCHRTFNIFSLRSSPKTNLQPNSRYATIR